MVAAFVLMIGVLGTFIMVDGANKKTRDNSARSAATALSREILEQARTLDYAEVSKATLRDSLRAKTDLSGTLLTDGRWVLNRKGIAIAVDATICIYDDPLDGLGNPGPADPCGAGNVSGQPPATVKDSNPDDFRRVTLTLSWLAGGGSTPPVATQACNTGNKLCITQVSQINNPGGGLGPRITKFPNPNSGVQITSGNSVALYAESTNTHILKWTVDDGRPAGRGNLSGPGTVWNWSWSLGTVDSGTPREDWVVDGAYAVNAQPFDSRGVPGELRVASVMLNRRVPLAPSGFLGGRSGGGGGGGNLVEMDWLPNVERDIIGYRVWRRGATGSTRICPAESAGENAVWTKLSCTDSNAPSGNQVTYDLRAVDRVDLGSPSSLPRTLGGDVSSFTTASNTGTRLDEPGLSVTTVNGKPQLTITPPAGTVLFYRVYRDGERIGRTTGNATLYLDANPTSTQHRYQVSAVHDPSYNEGRISGEVTWNG